MIHKLFMLKWLIDWGGSIGGCLLFMGLLNKLIGVCCGGIFVMLVDLVMIHGCSLGISMFILSLMIKEE